MNSKINPLCFYKCLADETRLKSLLLIYQEKELCVCELMKALEVSQPKISRHLAQLRQCQIVLDRREGQWVHYRINPTLPQWTIDVIHNTAVNNQSFLEPCYKALDTMNDRPIHKIQFC